MIPILTFRERLMREFEARRAANKRYSLRAFAGLLGVDHATLSQILRGKRRLPSERIAVWSRKLKIAPEEASVYAAVARLADDDARIKEERLRQWAAEILALLTQSIHREILLASRAKNFRADSVWLAAETGASVDDVNVALSRLLRLGLLEMNGSAWLDKTGLGEINARSFRRFVAEQVADKAGPLLNDQETR